MGRSLDWTRISVASVARWATAVILAAAALVVAAVAVLAIWRPPAQPSTDVPFEPSITRGELASIVEPNMANLPDGFSVHRTERGIAALRASDLALEDASGFVDAVLIEFDADDAHVGEHEDVYRSFAALFSSEADAEFAFAQAVAQLESSQGWGLAIEPRRPGYEPHPPLGDESVHYLQGMDYGYPELSVYLWRLDAVVIHTVDFHPYDRPGLIGVIARDLEAGARER